MFLGLLKKGNSGDSPNGAGKTTMLGAIWGSHQQREGRIILNDQDISKNSCIKKLVLGISYAPRGSSVW